MLVLLVVTNLALVTLTVLRAAPEYTSPSALFSPVPSAAGQPAEASLSTAAPQRALAHVPVLAVYGDGYAAGNGEGGQGPAGWPALVAGRTGARLELHAASQAGYASLSPAGQDYADLVRDASVADATVTLLFGSRNDADESLAAVQQNVRLVISAAQEAAPSDTLIVIGPVWSSADAPAGLLAVRDAMRDAADAAGVRFVDPLAANWFAEPRGLISVDGVSPNDAGHAHLADLVEPVVAAALTGDR